MQGNSNQHAADMILRSSDKELFYSWKIFLSISSPVFSDMFALPQPKPDAPDVGDTHDGLPVIDLEEDSGTLGHVLTLCHPPSCTTTKFTIDGPGALRAVLAATSKYDMKHAHQIALDALSGPALRSADPLHIYALACRYGRRDAAAGAARRTLALPSLVPGGYVPDLEAIDAGRLCRLLLYREACIAAVCSLATDHTWLPQEYLPTLFGCADEDGTELTVIRLPPSNKYRRGREERRRVHKWWMEYMRKSELALYKSPNGEAVKDRGLVDAALGEISTSACERCQAAQISETFRSFVQVFAENVNLRVAEVKINLEL